MIDIDNILLEWSYRVANGIPDIKSTKDIIILENVMNEMNIDKNISHNIINKLLFEKDDEGGLDPEELKKAKKMGLIHKGGTAWGKSKKSPTLFRSQKGKLVSVKKDIKTKEQKPVLKPSEFKDTRKASKDIGKDTKSTLDDKEEVGDKDTVISAIEDKTHGILAKANKRKDSLGKEGYNTVRELYSDISSFLKMSDKDKKNNAQELINKYKLSKNAKGTKLYVFSIPLSDRKILGENNKITNGLIKELEKYSQLGDDRIIKNLKNELAGVSKPNLKEKSHAKNDKNVAEIMNKEPFRSLDEKFHQLYGPKGKDNNILYPSNKYSYEYFKQSVTENTMLDNTIKTLKDKEIKMGLSVDFRKAIEQHRNRMLDTLKNWGKLNLEEREGRVKDSYNIMAKDMFGVDKDSAGAVLKNMAEMFLYDTELASGKQVYLPSHGSFPSGDKLRIDTDKGGVVEKISSVSVKFGEKSGIFGFPGETAQYQKYHPDPTKRNILKNRAGHRNAETGVDSNIINDNNKFLSMIHESGLNDIFKDKKSIDSFIKDTRTIQKEIEQLRISLFGDKYESKNLEKMRKQIEEKNNELSVKLQKYINKEILDEKIGKDNAEHFIKGPMEAVNIIAFSSILKTSNGLDVIEHNHQTVSDKGLYSKTTKGSDNIMGWKLSFRFWGERAGGLIAGYNEKRLK